MYQKVFVNRTLTVILIAAFLSSSVLLKAASAQTTTDDTPAAREDIEKLFVTLHLRDLMHNIMEMSQKQTTETVHATLRKKMPDISQKDLERIDALSSESLSKLDVDGMLDDMVPVYQRHLTKGDVAAMLAFYQSPTGQKMLREQPQMMAEAMKAVQPRMEKVMNDVMDQAEKFAKETLNEKHSGSEKN